LKRLLCATLEGLEAKVVEVETSFVRAIPSFNIVGLASSSIQEAKERVKSALLANGFTFPPRKITINLAPSDLKKSGSHFDLAIALSLALYGEETPNDLFIFGELGLDGALKDSSSIFPILLALSQKREIKAFVPKQSIEKLSLIPNLTLYYASSLKEAILSFKNKRFKKAKSKTLNYPNILGSYYYLENYPLDFKEVKGQEVAKRASLIAAVGFHNILFEGSAGSGKSMISKRIRYILPPMSKEEILKKAQIESFERKEIDFSPVRPFRSPHHTSSKASIFGGGSGNIKVGEVALANRGVLFFDELPHFSKKVLEALREPLQEGYLLVSRVHSKIRFETKFIFVAAQNPCPCGNLFSKTKECRCTPLEIKRYQNRLSEPILDRIELYVQMSEVSPEDKPTVTSKELHQKVINAFIFQKKREQEEFNGKLNEEEVEKFCILTPQAQDVLDKAIERFSLSFRAISNLKKVARSVADLEESEKIEKKHLLEALSYRRRT